MLLNSITLTDRIKVPTQRKFTDSGQMIVPCAIARTGSQIYSAGALGLIDVKPETPITVMRDEADVFDEDSLVTFRSVPVTIGHPKVDGKNISVTTDNAAELQVGVLEGMPVRDDNKLTGTLVVARQDAIDMIEDGTQELSAGYTCDIEVVVVDGEDQYFQRNIRANHIAIVDKGRAGSSVRIADEETEELVESKTVCKDITPDAAVEDGATPDVDIVVAKELVVGDEGYEVYSALMLLNDEVKAVNDYTDALSYCEDEDLCEVLRYILKEEQEHCVKLLGWLATQNTASVTTDETEDVLAKAKVVADSFEPVVAKDVVISDELEEANKTIAKLTDELDAGVDARVEVIMVAKDLTDLEDFSGKSISDIRELVVAEVMPALDLTDRGEAYIQARFDIVVEDSLSGESSMSKLLRTDSTKVVKTAKPVNIVDKARSNMIARQTATKS